MEDGRLFTLALVLILCSLIMHNGSCVPEENGNVQKTLAMVKPDGVRGNYSEQIKTIIEDQGFVIVAERILHLQENDAKTFYAEHSERAFFPSLIKFMTSGPVLAMIIEREDAVSFWRALIGPTDAIVAKVTHPKSIRALCGSDSQNNCVHGSDSLKSAAREIEFFFGSNLSVVRPGFEPGCSHFKDVRLSLIHQSS